MGFSCTDKAFSYLFSPALLDRVERSIGPRKLDFIESFFPGLAFNLGVVVPLAALFLPAINPMLTVSLCQGTTLLGFKINSLYQNYKRKLITAKIKEIVAQSQEQKSRKKVALVLNCTYCPYEELFNINAFHSRRHVKHLQDIAKGHSIDEILNVSTKEDLHEGLQKYQDLYFDLLWLRGHGEPKFVRFGKKYRFQSSDQDTMKLMRSKIRKNSKVVFNSCSTGKGEDNIAHTFSCENPEATILAPTEPVPSFRPSCGFTIKEDGSASFSTNQRDITRIYRNGEIQGTARG